MLSKFLICLVIITGAYLPGIVKQAEGKRTGQKNHHDNILDTVQEDLVKRETGLKFEHIL